MGLFWRNAFLLSVPGTPFAGRHELDALGTYLRFFISQGNRDTDIYATDGHRWLSGEDASSLVETWLIGLGDKAEPDWSRHEPISVGTVVDDELTLFLARGSFLKATHGCLEWLPTVKDAFDSKTIDELETNARRAARILERETPDIFLTIHISFGGLNRDVAGRMMPPLLQWTFAIWGHVPESERLAPTELPRSPSPIMTSESLSDTLVDVYDKGLARFLIKLGWATGLYRETKPIDLQPATYFVASLSDEVQDSAESLLDRSAVEFDLLTKAILRGGDLCASLLESRMLYYRSTLSPPPANQLRFMSLLVESTGTLSPSLPLDLFEDEVLRVGELISWVESMITLGADSASRLVQAATSKEDWAEKLSSLNKVQQALSRASRYLNTRLGEADQTIISYRFDPLPPYPSARKAILNELATLRVFQASLIDLEARVNGKLEMEIAKGGYRVQRAAYLLGALVLAFSWLVGIFPFLLDTEFQLSEIQWQAIQVVTILLLVPAILAVWAGLRR